MIDAAKLVTVVLWFVAGICIWWRASKLLNRLFDLERQMRKEILDDAKE